MDLRACLKLFAENGNLRRIKARVSTDLELAALCRDEFSKGGGAALLFEQLLGFRFRGAANLFGSETRMAQILRSRCFADKLLTVLNAEQGTTAERLGKAVELSSPRKMTQHPLWRAQENATLLDLPAVRSWPQEKQPYFTMPLVVSRCPLTGVQNLGLYRVQVLDGRRAAINLRPDSGAGEHLAVAEKRRVKLPVALVFGGDPALPWLASAPLPSGCDEYRLFQTLFDEGLLLANGYSQDLCVPADAEFVVEGVISPGLTCREGPFGNHTGSYVSRSDCPLFEMTSIAWREQAIMPFTVVGPPLSENIYLARTTESLIRVMLKIDFPEIVDIKIPDSTAFHGATLLKVAPLGQKKSRLIDMLWHNSPLRKAKLLVLFDEDIELDNYAQAWWRLVNQLDGSRIYRQGGQVAIDATGVDPQRLVVEDGTTTELINRRRQEYDG